MFRNRNTYCKRKSILAFLTILFIMSCKSDHKDVDGQVKDEIVSSLNQDLDDLPAGSLIVMSAGDSIYVRTMGSGPPILIIHGGPGMDHSYLLPHMGSLADAYTLVFYDQRASGRSEIDVDSNTVSMEGFINDMERIRGALNIDKWHVMGHSWGGLLAMCYALEHQDRLMSLLLINSTAASSELQAEERSLLAQRETEEDRLAREQIIESSDFQDGKASAYEALFKVIFRNEFYDHDYIDSLVISFQPDFVDSGNALKYLSKDFSDIDLHEQLHDMMVPTLIVYGQLDVQSKTAGPALAEHIPNNVFSVLNESGHFPFVEDKEAFFKLVRAFLADPGSRVSL